MIRGAVMRRELSQAADRCTQNFFSHVVMFGISPTPHPEMYWPRIRNRRHWRIGDGAEIYFVKITLRRRASGLFLGEKGNWVASGLQARAFTSESEALSHCKRLAEEDVYIYLLFDDPRLNRGARDNCSPV
jgi:hypothetical protein